MSVFVQFAAWLGRNFDDAGPVVAFVVTSLVVLPFAGNEWAAAVGLVAAGLLWRWLGTENGRAYSAEKRRRRETAQVAETAAAALVSSGLQGVEVEVSPGTSASSYVLDLATPVGRSDAEVLARADALAAALGAWRCVPVPGSRHGAPRLLVQQSDPLATPLTGSFVPAVEGSWDAATPVPVGRDDDSNDVAVSMWAQTVLVGGSPGAGKSAFAWLPLLGVALDPTALVVVIDLKPHGIETAPLGERADHAVYDPASALVVLQRVWKLIDQRNAALRERMWEKVPTTDRIKFPPVLIVVDEAAELGHCDEGQVALKWLQRIVAVGRASGVTVMLSTQKPDGQTIPTNLRDLFAQRVCFRVGNRAQAETVLGVLPEGAEPWKIPTAQAGTGYLVGTDGRARRFRSLFLDRDQLIEVADRATTARRAFLEANPSAPAQLPPIQMVERTAVESVAQPRRRRS